MSAKQKIVHSHGYMHCRLDYQPLFGKMSPRSLERAAEIEPRSWTFQHKSCHLVCSFWSLLGFITIPYINYDWCEITCHSISHILWSFPWFSLPVCVIMHWYYEEKLDAVHSQSSSTDHNILCASVFCCDYRVGISIVFSNVFQDVWNFSTSTKWLHDLPVWGKCTVDYFDDLNLLNVCRIL